MASLYVLDRYTSKNLIVDNIPDAIFDELQHREKIVYRVQDKNQEILSIGEVVKHELDTDRHARFEKRLEWEDLTYFTQMQEYAASIYPDFRKTFRKTFVWSIPVTARFHIYADQIYFYFFAQERYVFTEYVRNLRHKLGKNIFLYQVGARDLVRLSPWYDNIIWYNNISLCEKSTRDLPEVSMEDIVLQNLEGRDIEKLKTRYGKFKPSLWYEVDLYQEESKMYPPKWSLVKDSTGTISGRVLSYNIMLGDVKIKSDEWTIYVFPKDQLSLVQ